MPPKASNFWGAYHETVSEFLRQHRTMIAVQLQRRIISQTIQIEESRAASDGKDASICAIKALAGNCAVLP